MVRPAQVPARPVPVADLGPARWLVDSITEFGGRVEQLVPSTYAGCVRVFHRPDQGRPDGVTPGSWAEVATRFGTTFHPEAQWSALTGDDPRPEVSYEPLVGSLDSLTLSRLAVVLERHTSTPDRCHVALWDGYGSSPRSWDDAPCFALPGRRHRLFAPIPVAAVVARSVDLEVAGLEEDGAGGSTAITTLGGSGGPGDVEQWVRWSRAQGLVQSPSWWWPEDRAWVVHTEVDHDSTLVAGSAALRTALLEDPDLECLAVTATTSLHANADRVNDGR